MSNSAEVPFPFDFTTIAADMRQRFGWDERDLNAAMTQLMPAALSGYKHFGSVFPGAPASATAQRQSNPWILFAAAFDAPQTDQLALFYGPEFVRKAVADQIASVTGLQKDAIQEIMPVAATLAMGQIMRPFLPGQGQDLLDAFLRGFARGRPKPVQQPLDYLQGYGQAVHAFWQGVLKPAMPSEGSAADVEDEDVEDDAQDPAESDLPDDAETADSDAKSELDALVTDWMTTSRSIQSSQFQAFDDFFAKAVKDGVPEK